ncbi:DUF2804 domain-containing protein [Chitinivorax sp. PXF-14]|uniref:DUF2804 domain-containing protein n=1 Tax=Chitinivorax sp. PXF-14 TaxID=3230488 RepID=UPI0034665775
MERSPHTLGPAPAQVVRAGAPATGRYSGLIERIDWQGLAGSFRRSAWWKRFHHKRWQYVGIATERCFIGLAIVDIGWTNTAFAYLFDREQGKVIASFSQDGLPGLTAGVADQAGPGTLSWFKHTGGSLRYEHLGGTRYRLTAWTKVGLEIDAELDSAGCAPFLLSIGPIEQGGCAHATQKSPALRVSGVARAGGKQFALGGGHASLDYSNGLLARDTQWRWASAHTPAVGFNLQQGYFGTYENMLWLDGEMIATGPARFEFDPARPLDPWTVRTEDDLINLRFEPEGARQESKNLLIAASYYIQPIGTFSGYVRAHEAGPKREVQGLLGVTEDHRSRW